MSDYQILSINHIEAKPGSGKPRIVGKGITVQFLATLIDQPEWSVERICEEYNLTPAEVHAAWSYYYDHKAEIDAAIEQAEQPIERPDEAAYRAQVQRMKERHNQHNQ